MLSETRDVAGAKAFFRSAKTVTGPGIPHTASLMLVSASSDRTVASGIKPALASSTFSAITAGVPNRFLSC
jgi:hypothetical protein